MTHPIQPAPGAAPRHAARIPTPPPRVPVRRPLISDRRWLLFPAALAVGVALGIVAYQWLPGVDTYFDYWLALALG